MRWFGNWAHGWTEELGKTEIAVHFAEPVIMIQQLRLLLLLRVNAPVFG